MTCTWRNGDLVIIEGCGVGDLTFLLVIKGSVHGKIAVLVTFSGHGDGDLPIFW